MDIVTHKGFWRTAAGLLAFTLAMAGFATGAWWYQSSKREPAAQSPAQAVVTPHATAIAVLAPEPASKPAAATPPVSAAADLSAARPRFQISVDPLQDFNSDLKHELVEQLGPAFPELSKYLSMEPDKGTDPAYRNFTFQVLDAAAKAPSTDQPAILLAADLLASKIWCGIENKEVCDQVGRDFTQRNLSFDHDELAGGFAYSRDLLWRIWRDYPNTPAGERAFVLLLGFGWDTSGMCAKGSDQFREVIRQGETFLDQRPTSPNRALVALLVGQAYATWWALSNEYSEGMADYVDPKSYQTGADEARLQAIHYFEVALQMSPGIQLADYANQAIPALRQEQVPQDYKFFCVYD
jgi:hypothetical protein